MRTNGRVSSTGFPFKVLTVPGTLADEEQYERRPRMCDLGYLREAYVDEKGRLLGRCPAEPVDDYVRKGGDPVATEDRACLCNALMANIGLLQHRDDYTELPLYTGGDALMNLPLGSAADPQYDADDVLAYLRGNRPALGRALQTSAEAPHEQSASEPFTDPSHQHSVRNERPVSQHDEHDSPVE